SLLHGFNYIKLYGRSELGFRESDRERAAPDPDFVVILKIDSFRKLVILGTDISFQAGNLGFFFVFAVFAEPDKQVRAVGHMEIVFEPDDVLIPDFNHAYIA